MILAIDPGTRKSGVVEFIDGAPGYLCGVMSNDDIEGLALDSWDQVVIEMVEHFGANIRAGKETFETCVWIGRFMAGAGSRARRITRRTVKLHLCGTMKAKDPDVRQAIIDRFGGKEKAIGNKANPGPLYGVKSHAWQALALALTYHDLGDEACYEAP